MNLTNVQKLKIEDVIRREEINIGSYDGLIAGATETLSIYKQKKGSSLKLIEEMKALLPDPVEA